MNNMDYEKKYKEALELARVAAFNGHQSLMEGIFPELCDAEDERIREYLIRYIDNTMKSSELKSKLLAWLENIPYTIDHEKREGFHLGYKAALEKQGEKSSTVDIESMIEAYEQRLINQGNGVRNSPIVNMCVAAFKHGVENTLDELHLKQGETSPILSNSSNIGKGEQASAWSEEDERMFDYALDMIEWYSGKNEDKSRLVSDWLKSIKSRVQPKQEWSEEDQNALEDVREAVVHYWGGDTQDILLYWLKSIKQKIKGE